MNDEAQPEEAGAEDPDLDGTGAASPSGEPGDLSREAAIIETVLFLETEPLDLAALSRASGLGKDVVERALELLRDELSGPTHGLEPVQLGGGWTLAPKKELWASLRERYGRKSEQKLSKAALETLSIIAYSQPITRAEIEAIRGVSADNMMRLLMDRNLVQEVGKKDAPGKPVQYGTTRDFLKFFRLNSISELPRLDDVERERFALEEGEE
ncbi:MAG TPA: SMC-Scp complex subunit ScpB [Spirochaetales bacterium]|nr:SMC-Scp complex subunit ScpB [Spirochaetales bacterium]